MYIFKHGLVQQVSVTDGTCAIKPEGGDPMDTVKYADIFPYGHITPTVGLTVKYRVDTGSED